MTQFQSETRWHRGAWYSVTQTTRQHGRTWTTRTRTLTIPQALVVRAPTKKDLRLCLVEYM